MFGVNVSVMSDLISSYYDSLLLSIHRGWTKGRFSNAKPLYIISIIDLIDCGLLLENKLYYDDMLKSSYTKTCKLYEPDIKIAPFFKPYFHLAREEFYNIKWKEGVLPEHKWHTPSGKFLREHVVYSFLDENLWSLLQNAQYRQYTKNNIVNHYLRPDQESV